MWLLCTVASAIFLGMYEVFKKLALRGNAVLPVLFLTPVCCTLFFLPCLLLSRLCPETIQDSVFYVGALSGTDHLYVLLKSAIVLTSWCLAYYAMRNLPITIASPVKSTQPMFVLVGAFIVFGERMNIWQWAGALVALFCLFFYSRVGEKEGISFRHNKWLWCLIAAVLTGAVSGLYDKYMMRHFDRMAVQIWYTLYQIGLMLPIMVAYFRHERKMEASAAEAGTPVSVPPHNLGIPGGFQMRWSVIGLSLFLCVSDFLYFYALSIPDSLISVVSPIRRSGVIVPFIVGAFFLKEKNIKQKALLLSGVLIGILCLYFGSR